MIIGICIGIFLLFTVYMAFNVKMGISSDSWYHLKVSQEYAKTLGIPENNPDTYQWRDISHIPYLYFWINGRILNLNSILLNINEAILLRIISILYSLLTVIGVYLLSKEFLNGKILQTLPTVILTNTLMFLFLSSSINYDNLGNLFAVFSIYFFIKSIKNRGENIFPILMILTLCLGVLTKYTLTPLAFILVLLLSIDIWKNRNTWKLNIGRKELLLLIPTIILIALNIQLYGTNLYKYKELTPSCEKVLTYEQCLSNGVFYRDEITIPSVDVDLFRMIKQGERVDPISYSIIWTWLMTKKIVGIMGDSSFYHSIPVITIFFLFYVGTFLYGVFNIKKYTPIERYLLGILFLYGLILMIVQNYDMYLKKGYPDLALQGRYIFPVIAPLYISLVMTWAKIKNKRVRNIVVISILILLIALSIPYFLLNIDNQWLGVISY